MTRLNKVHAFVLALLILTAPLLGWLYALLRPGLLPNTQVRVGDERTATLTLPGDASLSTFLDEQAGLLAQRPLRLVAGFHEFRPSYTELGASFVPSDVEDRAQDIGRSGNPFEALRALVRALSGAGNEVRWRPRTTDTEKLEQYVVVLGRAIDRPAVPGTWGVDGTAIEGIPSEELNVDLTVDAIAEALRRGSDVARVDTQVIKPPMMARNSAPPPSSASTEPLSQQETRYGPRSDRGVNVELAAKKLDQQVLLPGARFSFNEVVGKRTPERGFRPAPEVRGGRLVDPTKEPCPSCIGGGVCQVAGTLHAAAFFAGLDILQQEPHSRLPTVCYLPPGLDTAVFWDPSIDDLARTRDLVMRNPYPFPVVVRADATGGKLSVRLFGAMRPYRVDCCYRVDRDRTAGDGSPGVTITRMRMVYKPDARPVELKQVSYSDPETCMSDSGWQARCDVCPS